MNDRNNRELPLADEQRLERLVDGELSSDEYRALLATFDEEAGGWKRCALAFLENQALGGELKSIGRSGDWPAKPAAAPDPPARHGAFSFARWRALAPLAIAAGLLLAFGLGLAAPKFFSPAAKEGVLAGNQLAGQAVVPKDQQQAALPRHEVFRPIGNLRLVMDSADGSATEAGQVPVYEVDSDWQRALAADQPTFAPELIDLLRQRGYEVRHEQQFLPAPLEDGRQIIVPVEGYQITPVGMRY
jgi:hypothetical protein